MTCIVKPKKKLGQHFTKDKGIIKFFLEQCKDCKKILEIGSGRGELTIPLSEIAEVTGIEIDAELVKCLRSKGLKVIEADALEVNFEGYDCIVGNIPYNITGPLISKIVKTRGWKKSVLLVQREVAQRLLANPGEKEYGRLTALVRLVADVRPGPIWPPSAFWPPPEVYSQHVVLIKKKEIDERLLNEFERFTACMFSQRNKKARKVAKRCGTVYEGEKRVRDLTPEELWELFLSKKGYG